MELRKIIRNTIREYLNEQKDSENIYENNFKKWFKNSEVVDESGKPLILHHGSKNKDFNEFNMTNDIGFHFSVSKNIAKNMSGKYEDDNGFTRYIEILEVYLSIQKLGGLPDLEFWRKSDLIKTLNEINNFGQPMKFVYDDRESLLDNIKKFSFEFSNLDGNYKDIDGFIYFNEYEGRFTKDSKMSYIALNPNQIKSTKNDGTFDINDNNMFS
jgi:hypothetical protein